MAIAGIEKTNSESSSNEADEVRSDNDSRTEAEGNDVALVVATSGDHRMSDGVSLQMSGVKMRHQVSRKTRSEVKRRSASQKIIALRSRKSGERAAPACFTIECASEINYSHTKQNWKHGTLLSPCKK